MGGQPTGPLRSFTLLSTGWAVCGATGVYVPVVAFVAYRVVEACDRELAFGRDDRLTVRVIGAQ